MNEATPRFPIFISLDGKRVLVVGGGNIAARRARVLLNFGALVTVVAPDLSPDMRELLGRVTWREERYGGLEEGCALVIAATNDRKVNRQIGEDALKLSIPASVADQKEESTFWFPAIIQGGGFIAGLISQSGDHGAVKRATQKIRKNLEEIP